METAPRVVVTGGGVKDASVRDRPTKPGWCGVLLQDGSDPESESTRRAAGSFHTLNGSTNMAAAHRYTSRLNCKLTDLSGGLHPVGGVTPTYTPDQFVMRKVIGAVRGVAGLDTDIIRPAILTARPALDPDGAGLRG